MSRIAHLVGRVPTQVRKPEKGTRPKLFYIEGDAAALVPSAAPPAADYMWSALPTSAAFAPAPAGEPAGAPRRTYGVAEQHRNSWGFRVSLYLWTKSLAAGAFLVPALLSLMSGWEPLRPGPVLVAGLFLALTGVLLVSDLRQPQRFLWVLTRPQWRSWLVRGAYAIGIYGLLLAVHFMVGMGWLHLALPRAFTITTILMAATTAVYTAFLFGQAKGRDLWQSALLGPHLLIQALCAGAALFRPAWLLWLLPLNGLVVAAEVFGHHATEDARRAARLIQESGVFTTGVLAIGHLLPLALLKASRAPSALAGGLALLGLLFWEHLFVQAPQRVPLA
jgi:formate-dependent nitrite reductase membrane component NrfD